MARIDKYYYDFREIFIPSSTRNLIAYVNNGRALISQDTKKWSAEKSGQWQLRNYLSVKLIFQSSILASTLEYTQEKNVLITESYLKYYILLSAARAFIFTIPDLEWKNVITMEMTHQNIINTSCNYLHRFDSKIRSQAESLFNLAKDQREIFSYSLPSKGRALLAQDDLSNEDVFKLATIFIELAQLNSEILYSSIQKNHPEKLESNPSDEDIELAASYADGQYFDEEDWYRFVSHFRKFSSPAPLDWTASEGFVEDVFGSWSADDEGLIDAFDPDKNWHILFNFH